MYDSINVRKFFCLVLSPGPSSHPSSASPSNSSSSCGNMRTRSRFARYMRMEFSDTCFLLHSRAISRLRHASFFQWSGASATRPVSHLKRTGTLVITSGIKSFACLNSAWHIGAKPLSTKRTTCTGCELHRQDCMIAFQRISRSSEIPVCAECTTPLQTCQCRSVATRFLDIERMATADLSEKGCQGECHAARTQ